MTDAKDPASNLAALIRCPSVTPSEGGALSVLQGLLEPLGFDVSRPVFSDADTPDVENLYARRGAGRPVLMYAGHTDVVPVGDEVAWTHPPFAAEIADGMMFGRGAVDMKGGIACFVAAVARHLEHGGMADGSIALLITGDEEGPAVNGSVKLLKWAAERGEKWDAAIVGEPTNPNSLGDMIKIGRRGSQSGTITVHGKQGHAAYPHLADNPVRGIVQLVSSLLDPPFDEGTENFQPTNLEATTIDVGNTATNVIPARATASFNIRFGDRWTTATIRAEIERRLSEASKAQTLRQGKEDPVRYDIAWAKGLAEAFLTSDADLVETLAGAVEQATGTKPTLSTSGGTSDARFIKNYCPVAEFGLVGQTMHMVDERVALADLEKLTQIYERFLADWFRAKDSV